MNILRNFKNFLIYFAIIFGVSFLYYFGKIVYMYHGVPGSTSVRYLFLVLLFLRDYFFPLSLMASMLSLLFIAGTIRLRGGISVIATLIIISFISVLYPVAVRYISYPRTGDILPNLPPVENMSVTPGSIQLIDGNYIYAENIEGDGGYKNILTAKENIYERKLSVASYAKEDKKNITLEHPIVIENGKEYVFVRDKIEKQNKKIINVLDVFFAVPLLPYFNSLFTFFTSVRIPYYIYAILFLALFLFLTGIYILGSAFSVESYKYHNVLTAFFIYIVVLMSVFLICYRFDSLYGLKKIFTYLGYFRLSLLILAISVFINILAFALSRVFNFKKYYKE